VICLARIRPDPEGALKLPAVKRKYTVARVLKDQHHFLYARRDHESSHAAEDDLLILREISRL
jgi:hypothetical protein